MFCKPCVYLANRIVGIDDLPVVHYVNFAISEELVLGYLRFFHVRSMVPLVIDGFLFCFYSSRSPSLMVISILTFPKKLGK